MKGRSRILPDKGGRDIVSLRWMTRIGGPEKWERDDPFKMVRIWSQEHRAWWRDKGTGYTTVEAEAGTFTMADAYARTKHCGPEKQIHFVRIKQRSETQPILTTKTISLDQPESM